MSWRNFASDIFERWMYLFFIAMTSITGHLNPIN